MKHILIGLTVLFFVSSAEAGWIKTLKEVVAGGDLDDPDVIQVDIEDAHIRWDEVSGSPIDNPGNLDTALVVGPELGVSHVALIGVPDFFENWPIDISSSCDIMSVTMRIRQRSPIGGEVIGVARVTSPWLTSGAEATVTALHRDPGNADPYWAGDLGKIPGVDTEGNPTYDDFVGFSASDYTTEDMQWFTITDTTHNDAHEVDITEIAKDWFSKGNHGLALLWAYEGQWLSSCAPYFQPSERDSTWDTLPDESSPGIEFIFPVAEPITIGLLGVGGLALLGRKH